ncbi:MAG: hypothetical protein EBQ96_03325 [Proteobacteria bacterium]|nr:hypothetical protein [Pseudomonadota bacterium]
MAESQVSAEEVILEAKLALGDFNPPVAEGEQGVVAYQPSPPARERAGEDEDAKMAASRLWLVSFTDLFSLMLCFFVMLYSMKDPDLTKIGEMTGKAVRGSNEADSKGFAGGENVEVNISRVEYGEALNLDYLQGVLKNAISQAKLENEVKILQAKDHLRLVVDDDAVFADASTLSAGGEMVAKGLAERLSRLSNRISVVYVPSSSGEWQSGMTQAAAFGEAMRDGGYRKQFTVLADGSGEGPGIEVRVEADDGRLR